MTWRTKTQNWKLVSKCTTLNCLEKRRLWKNFSNRISSFNMRRRLLKEVHSWLRSLRQLKSTNRRLSCLCLSKSKWNNLKLSFPSNKSTCKQWNKVDPVKKYRSSNMKLRYTEKNCSGWDHFSPNNSKNHRRTLKSLSKIIRARKKTNNKIGSCKTSYTRESLKFKIFNPNFNH